MLHLSIPQYSIVLHIKLTFVTALICKLIITIPHCWNLA